MSGCKTIVHCLVLLIALWSHGAQIQGEQVASSTVRSYAAAAGGARQSAQPDTVPTTPRSYAHTAQRHGDNHSPGHDAGSVHSHATPPTPPPRRGGSPRQTTTLSPAAANISDEELRNFSDDVWRSDTNNAGSAVRVNWQGRTHGSNPTDVAPAPLLSIPASTLQGPTIVKLRQLYDNYVPDSALSEDVTPVERDENSALLEAILSTQVMAKTRKFVTDKGLVANTSPNAFRDFLHTLWFTQYPRLGGSSPVGSSAFEHVFLAEIRKGEISGMHNWVYFASEENSGKLDYLGHIRYINFAGRGSVVKHHFRWSNITKPVGSMFIGTSPELEMALYTVCFLARPDNKCPVRLGSEPFYIQTYGFTSRGRKYIGTAYPDI